MIPLPIVTAKHEKEGREETVKFILFYVGSTLKN